MLMFANPTTRPAKRRSKKGAVKMATKKRKRRATSRRRVHRNPAAAAPKRRRRTYKMRSNPKRRRRVTRNPGGFAKGILGELASMNGVILIGSAVLAPTVTDLAVKTILPVQYQDGYTGLAAKAVFVAGAAYVLDRYVKSRHAALGFAIGGLGTIVNDGINVIRARQALPATVAPAVADEIAQNPTAFKALMDGQYSSLNGYQESPMSGYGVEAMASEFDSLN